MQKKPFLVVYDYGSGGVWAVIFAIKREQIALKYPRLKIIESRPGWMTDVEYTQIESRLSFDIDDHPHGWLLSVVAEQERGE